MATILAAHPYLVEATSGTVSWQEAMRRAIRDPLLLLDVLGLSPSELVLPGTPENAIDLIAQRFPMLVPWEFAARMQPGNPDDPLLRQVLISSQESGSATGYSSDPVGDVAAEVLPGLLQKYASRALLVTTGSCAVHCRYCFRRQFAYSQVPKSPAGWQRAIDYLRGEESIEELILSGGDPLMLSDSSLNWLVQQTNELETIERLRIHTRMPVVLPQRVCDSLLNWLGESRKTVVLVLHINHPQEIDEAVSRALAKLRSAGAILLNQAVLLRGINDQVATQRALSNRLIANGVLPYYLHQLDRVEGASHFEVPTDEGQQIISKLRAQISGYGVPLLVSEEAGKTSKTPL